MILANVLRRSGSSMAVDFKAGSKITRFSRSALKKTQTSDAGCVSVEMHIPLGVITIIRTRLRSLESTCGGWFSIRSDDLYVRQLPLKYSF